MVNGKNIKRDITSPYAYPSWGHGVIPLWGIPPFLVGFVLLIFLVRFMLCCQTLSVRVLPIVDCSTCFWNSEWVSEWVSESSRVESSRVESSRSRSWVELEQLPFKWWWGPLCTRPTHLFGFYSAGSLKQQSADWHVSAWKPYIFINILRTKAIPIHILFTYSYIRLKPKINAHRSIVYLIMLNYCIIIEAFVLAIKKLRWLKK